MKLLSVAVPCYNSAAYMENCIKSLLTGGDEIEIIIVNDGSKDDTGAIAEGYRERFPDTIKVIHQENKGHGGAINSAIAAATGKYFKVVDSDDTVNSETLQIVLKKLRENELDMLVTNYKYTHEDPNDDVVISYRRPLPCNRVIGWRSVRYFSIEQYFTIHSVLFRTECIRKSGLVLPEHVFYEDNVFVYAVIPYVKKLMFINKVLYNYTIGREGQSVQEDIIVKRYKHQILASQTIFTMYRLDDIKEKKQRQYMYHTCVMLLLIATVFARLNRTEESEADVKAMWKACYDFDPPKAERIKKYSLAAFVNFDGQVGREFAIKLYRLAQKVVRFN